MRVCEIFEGDKVARRRDIVAEAKKLFGVTNNPREAGYILLDGAMLDFSGRHHDTNDYKRDPESARNVLKKADRPDYMDDHRLVDHREVNDLYGIMDNTKAMHRFMAEAPALRFHAGIGFELNAKPTPVQIAKALAAHFSISRAPVTIDVSNRTTMETLVSREFSRREVPEIMGFIHRALNISN
jgi:hypothetical protein